MEEFKAIVVIGSKKIPAASAEDAIRMEAKYAEGEAAWIEYGNEQSRRAVENARDQRVCRNLGGTQIFHLIT